MQTQKSKSAKGKVGIVIAIGIIAIGVGLATTMYKTNLISSKVTETVKIVSVTGDGYSGCTVQTPDNYLVKLPTCDGKEGDLILATYNANQKYKANTISP